VQRDEPVVVDRRDVGGADPVAADGGDPCLQQSLLPRRHFGAGVRVDDAQLRVGQRLPTLLRLAADAPNSRSISGVHAHNEPANSVAP
jgi:hypothetical protein